MRPSAHYSLRKGGSIAYTSGSGLRYTWLMTTIRKTVKVPANRRLRLDLDLSPLERYPFGEARFEIVLNLPSRDEIKAKNKAAWEKLRELTKDSTFAVEKFLEMKNADRALETAIEERTQGSVQ
jgi:hypothetical protein